MSLDQRHLPHGASGRADRVSCRHHCHRGEHRPTERGSGLANRYIRGRPIWTEFLRKLTRRGLRGATLAILDAHAGIKTAISKVLSATWRRCRIHFQRNAFLPLPEKAGVSAFIATAFARTLKTRSARSGAQSPISSSPKCPSSPPSWTRPSMTSWPACLSPRPIGHGWTRQTRSRD
ncbi:transposase [Rhodovulum visakhapatnamense]|uniref:transposase n=1 Tax=Rhodovulum visakhapatnamense TaxID=364297 RepID=UPI003B21E590